VTTPAEALLQLEDLRARRAARADMVEYVRYLRLGIEPAAHHRLILERLALVESGAITRLMIEIPPGSGKSTYGSIVFPSWYLGRAGDRRVLAASHTTELAERWGRRVRNLVAGDEYRALFPACTLSADSQAAGRWSTTSGGEYYAAGVGSAILGYRATLGVIDDPVAGREAADSELQRSRVWEWYISDFKSRLTPGAAVVLIMQRWHEDDLAGRLLLDQDKGGERWDVLRLPMEAEEDDPLGRPVGAPLWPEWYTNDMREQARRDPRVWSALYQQSPRAATGGELKREWLRFYRTMPRCKVAYILVDPASGKRKTNDFSAIWVIGLGDDGNLYVLDLVRDRLNLAERAGEVIRLHRMYKPIEVRYERYGMQADIEHLESEMEQQSYRFRVVEVGGALRKEDRIRRLIPIFEASRFWFPATKTRTLHNGQTVDLIAEFIEEEYLAFPVGRHDDGLDALSRIAEPGMALKAPMQPAERPRFREHKINDSTVGY